MAMIGVVVSPEDTIDLVDRVCEELVTKIGRGVDKKPFPFAALDDDGYTCPAIAWFSGIALPPIAADSRDPGRGA
ncbi:hypothetical protein GCM10011515_10290 [Tsuneonella deserti]|uniref:Uncharacterized protein n=1 Tax=Tsuneonella deserti TaxID=2035528 RepID=A0ABQ1S4B7_9SPHN|nr:hypothetical protein GCM10011515_10290 [Tsuneonella deserti]